MKRSRTRAAPSVRWCSERARNAGDSERGTMAPETLRPNRPPKAPENGLVAKRRIRVHVMIDPGLRRFLELVVRELPASDARLELGGKDPEDPRLVFRPAPNGRVVVVFDAPPADRGVGERRVGSLVSPV